MSIGPTHDALRLLSIRLWGIAHIYFLIDFRSRFIVAMQWLWSYLTIAAAPALSPAARGDVGRLSHNKKQSEASVRRNLRARRATRGAFRPLCRFHGNAACD